MENKVLTYFKGDELAAEVFLSKYSLNKEESPAQMFRRLANEFHSVECRNKKLRNRTWKKLSPYGQDRFAVPKDYDYFYNLFKDFNKIIPGGSILANLGNPSLGSTSNCYYIDLKDDSTEAIFQLCSEMSSIYKYRGGVGIDISKLRPREAAVHNNAKTSSGSVSFMPLFSKVTSTIAQEGRRGALMISISVDHPDVLEFITCKEDLTKITAANISVKITKEFTEALASNQEYFPLKWCKDTLTKEDLEVFDRKSKNIDYTYKHPLYMININGKDVYVKIARTQDLFHRLVEANHKSAEPGILLWDNITDYSLSSYYPQYRELGTNPCAEIPLGDKDACRLFAINLSTIDSGDMDEVYSRAYEQVILADYLVDLEETKIDQILTKINNPKSVEYQLWSTIKNTAKKGRRIGCGLTGLFDYLVKSKYNIKDNPRYALDIAEMLMRTKMKAELDATVDLAIMKGSFIGYTNKESSKLIDFIKEEFPLQYKKMCKYGRRNVSLSTVAPTGSISILAGCASGIEPLFAPYYKRKRKVSNAGPKTAVKDVDGENFEVYTVFHRKLYEWAELNNIKGTPEEIYRESPYYKLCADDLDYKFRIDLQSIVQKYTTHSISSTINLPEHTSVEEIENIYKYAMEVHLKGCTIYRSFSRSGILIKDTPNEVSFDQYDAPSRPKSLQAESFISKSKGITYAVIVGLLDGKPYEIFAAISPPGFKSQKGEIIKVKKGVYRWVGEDGDVLENLNSLSESSIEKITTLYISMLLRTGAKLPFVIKVAKKADGSITSFTSAVCRILGKYIPKGEEKDLCPECGEKLIHEGGCTKCTQCSYSLCLFTYEIKN